MELEFDKFFGIINRALHVNRVHPFIKRDKIWFLQSFILHGVFTLNFILIVYNLVYHDLNGNNFSQTCKDGVMFIVYIVVTIQYSVFIFYRKSLLKVISLVKKDYSMINSLTPDERAIVKTYANLGNRVCKQWMIILLLCGNTFLIKSVFLMAYYYYKGESQLVHFYYMSFPPFIEKRKNNLYVFLILYTSQMQYAFYGCTMYGAFVPLGPFLMSHASGQLAIVKMRIDNLFTDLNDEVITEKLKEIIIHLQQIYSFVDLFNDIFKVAYELTLKLMAVMLPVTVYEVIETMHQGEISLEFFSFVIGATLFSSTPCYYSQLLMDKGEEVRQALYFCGWEHSYNRRTCSTLHILLMHALRPVAIQTVFRTLCLNGMTDLFHQSYAIFNLMNAMWE